MYLSGKVTIDPSQLTHLDRVKPTKGFARLAHALTGGLVTTKEERETFCAVTILQQVNIVMRTLGIDNVIRLAKDDTVFYEDTEGKEADLKEAFSDFSSKAKPDDIHGFSTLELILEHDSAELSYLIAIQIQRTHRVGEHPIQIAINGVPNRLSNVVDNEFDRSRLDAIFASQQTYDEFVTRQKNVFAQFLNDMEHAFKKHMCVDAVNVSSAVKIIRPSKRITRPADVPRSWHHDPYGDPVHQDEYGFSDVFLFAWLWAELCHSNDIHCHDCTIVDSTGSDVLSVGAEGFQAGESNTMNVDESFTPPEGNDVQVTVDNEFAAEISDSTKSFSMLGGDTESGGWLSDIGGDGDAGSCGGGCGGGCGGCGGS